MPPPPMPPPPPPPPSEPADDPAGERCDDPASDPYLAVHRTRMAWTRTALAFAAVGGVILKTSVPTGLVVLATCPLVWAAGRLGGANPQTAAGTGPAPFVRRFRLVTITIVVVAAVALAVSVFARGRAA